MNLLSLFEEQLLHGFNRKHLADRFNYDPLTGGFVRAKGSWNAGARVGTVDGKGYLHVSIGGKFIRLHQLAWFLTHGWCPRYIDHKNNDKKDNRIDNLRPTNCTKNAGNIHPPKHNTSGMKGVSWNTKRAKWHAQIKLNGKQTYLGGFDTMEEAAERYAKAAILHFGEHAKGTYV